MARLIHPDGRETRTSGRGNLARAIFLSVGVTPRTLCLGVGRCGRCRVRFLDAIPEPTPLEQDVLSGDDLAAGFRLSCIREDGDWTLEAPPPLAERTPVLTQTAPVSDLREVPHVLAVDLGTTSIAWTRLAADGRSASGSFLNPQAPAGAEIMTRLAAALYEDLGPILSERVRTAILELAGPGTREISIAGNPTMTALFLGLEDSVLEGLAKAPYALCFDPAHVAPPQDSTPLAWPPLYWPPPISPFVGGDISAGLAALLWGDNPPKPPFVLADLGTNGECLLVLDDATIYAASAPMGPALEGSGLDSGMLAGPGAVVGAALSPTAPAGFELVLFPGSNAALGPLGLSGTGALALVALLKRVGLLDESGRFADPDAVPASPLAARLAKNLRRPERGPARFVVNAAPAVSLSAGDVEAGLKVKAAFSTMLDALFAAAGIGPDAVQTLQLAGALGEHAALDDLVELGFLPPKLALRTVKAGNTALAGAALLLQKPELRPRLAGLVRTIRSVDVAQSPNFQTRYIKALRFHA